MMVKDNTVSKSPLQKRSRSPTDVRKECFTKLVSVYVSVIFQLAAGVAVFYFL